MEKSFSFDDSYSSFAVIFWIHFCIFVFCDVFRFWSTKTFESWKWHLVSWKMLYPKKIVSPKNGMHKKKFPSKKMCCATESGSTYNPLGKRSKWKSKKLWFVVAMSWFWKNGQLVGWEKFGQRLKCCRGQCHFQNSHGQWVPEFFCRNLLSKPKLKFSRWGDLFIKY